MFAGSKGGFLDMLAAVRPSASSHTAYTEREMSAWLSMLASRAICSAKIVKRRCPKEQRRSDMRF
jgi:hypothetical protein